MASTDVGARYGYGDTHESSIAQLLGDPSAPYAIGRDADDVEFQVRQQAPGSPASFSVCLDRGVLTITH